MDNYAIAIICLLALNGIATILLSHKIYARPRPLREGKRIKALCSEIPKETEYQYEYVFENERFTSDWTKLLWKEFRGAGYGYISVEKRPARLNGYSVINLRKETK